MTKDAHGGLEVHLEARADGHRKIAEARQDRDLDVAVEHVALQVLEEHAHERAAVLRGLVAERARDVADDADGDLAQLRVLVRLERGVKERQEGLDVCNEALLECWK